MLLNSTIAIPLEGSLDRYCVVSSQPRHSTRPYPSGLYTYLSYVLQPPIPTPRVAFTPQILLDQTSLKLKTNFLPRPHNFLDLDCGYF